MRFIGDGNAHAVEHVGVVEVGAVEVEPHAQVIGSPSQRAGFQLGLHDSRCILAFFERAVEEVLPMQRLVNERGKLRRVGNQVAQRKFAARLRFVHARGETELLAPALVFRAFGFEQAHQAAVGARKCPLGQEVDEGRRLDCLVGAAKRQVHAVGFGHAFGCGVVGVVGQALLRMGGGLRIARIEGGFQRIVSRRLELDLGVFAIGAIARLLADLSHLVSYRAHLQLLHVAHILSC